jgi:hypothetical protein
VPPERPPIAAAALPPLPERRPLKSLSREQQEEIFRRNAALFSRRLERELVPRISGEVARILELGYAWELNGYDLDHVHIRYPRHIQLEGRGPLAVLLDPQTYHLLYHCKENPFRQRQAWLEELGEIESAMISLWIGELQKSDFDYRDYFYGSGRYSRPAEVSPERLAALAHAWSGYLCGKGEEMPIGDLYDRLRFIIGPQQPGYGQAFDRLFSGRAVISVGGAEESRLYRMNEVEIPNYWQPLTVYFTRSEKTGELIYSFRRHFS